jgi:hypothetical protein
MKGNAMTSLRQRVLQAELDHIEAEAQSKSRQIMAKADTLAAAHEFCDRINEYIDPRLRWRCRPDVVYQPFRDDCEIIVFPQDKRRFVECCNKIGVSLRHEKPEGSKYNRTSIDSLPDVHFILSDDQEETAAA